MAEMIHGARVIPLRDQPRLSPSIRPVAGRFTRRLGRDTLVVEVTNLTDKASFRGSTENLRLTERYTRTGSDTLHYEVTLEDSAAWTAPCTWAGRPSARNRALLACSRWTGTAATPRASSEVSKRE